MTIKKDDTGEESLSFQLTPSAPKVKAAKKAPAKGRGKSGAAPAASTEPSEDGAE